MIAEREMRGLPNIREEIRRTSRRIRHEHYKRIPTRIGMVAIAVLGGLLIVDGYKEEMIAMENRDKKAIINKTLKDINEVEKFLKDPNFSGMRFGDGPLIDTRSPHAPEEVLRKLTDINPKNMFDSSTPPPEDEEVTPIVEQTINALGQEDSRAGSLAILAKSKQDIQNSFADDPKDEGNNAIKMGGGGALIAFGVPLERRLAARLGLIGRRNKMKIKTLQKDREALRKQNKPLTPQSV